MSGIIDLIIPREKKFFDYLFKQVQTLDDSAQNLFKLSQNNPTNKEINATLKFIEDQGEISDKLYQEIVSEIHKSFITPIDREELYYLALEIDKTIESFLNVITALLYLNPSDFKKDEFFITQIKTVKESSELVKNIFSKPLNLKENTSNIKTINKLTKESQRKFRKALQKLFETKDCIIIIKKKELYEDLIDSMNGMKRIVDIFQRVLINHT